MLLKFLANSAALFLLAVQLTAPGALAQANRPEEEITVRRAIPVGEDESPTPYPTPLPRYEDIPVARAVPFDETPAPPESTPRPRPVEPADPVVAPTPAAPTPAAATPAPASMGERQLNIANAFFSRDMYDLAAPEYEKYLGQYVDPKLRPTALFRLGESYRKLGDRPAARNAYKSLLLNYTEGEFIGAGSYRLAEIYMEDENYSQALALYERAAVKTDDPAVKNAALFYAARACEKVFRRTEAREKYQAVIRAEGKNPYRDAARLALAKLLLDSKRNQEAIAQFEALSTEAEKPELRAEAKVRVGLMKMDLGQKKEAAAVLREALKMPAIGEWQESAQLGLVRVLYESEAYQEVIDTTKEMLPEAKDNARAELLMMAGNSHRRLDQFDEAGKLFSMVVEEFPKSEYADEARYARLISLYNAKDEKLNEAVDDFIASGPTDEKKAQAHLLKAEALFRDRKYAEAAPAYEAIDRDSLPEKMRPDALFKLGWSLFEAGQSETAAATFASFMEKYPRDDLASTALARMAISRQRSGDFPGALKDFNQLLEEYPKAKERELALQQMALILGQRKENALMAETFRKLLQEFPETAAAAEANFWIGWAAFENKDYAAAIGPLAKAGEAGKEEFFERATLRVILANFYLEKRDAVAENVDKFVAEETNSKVPAEVLRWLGEQYARDDKPEPAARYLTLLTGREGDRETEDWLRLARARFKLEEYDKATEAIAPYLEAATQPAEQATGLLLRGEIELALKNYEAAAATINKALEQQPEGRLNAEGRMLTGDLAMARGDAAEAAKIYLSLSVVFDDEALTPQAMEKAYKAYKQLGDEEAARKTLNDLQTRFPEYSQKNGLLN